MLSVGLTLVYKWNMLQGRSCTNMYLALQKHVNMQYLTETVFSAVPQTFLLSISAVAAAFMVTCASGKMSSEAGQDE